MEWVAGAGLTHARLHARLEVRRRDARAPLHRRELRGLVRPQTLELRFRPRAGLERLCFQFRMRDCGPVSNLLVADLSTNCVKAVAPPHRKNFMAFDTSETF